MGLRTWVLAGCTATAYAAAERDGGDDDMMEPMAVSRCVA